MATMAAAMGGGGGGGDGGGGGNHPDGGDHPDGSDADADGGENSGAMTYGSRGTRKRSSTSKPFGSRTPRSAIRQPHANHARVEPGNLRGSQSRRSCTRAHACNCCPPTVQHTCTCSSMTVTRLDQDHLRARDPRD